LLNGRLEGEEGVIPELVEMRPESRDPLGVQLVQATLPIRAIHDQAGLFQDPQMLGHRRATDRELAGYLPDPPGPIGEAFEDRPSSGMTQGVKLSRVVSYHLPVSYSLPLSRSRAAGFAQRQARA